MKITASKIKRILEKEYGYENLDSESQKWFVDSIISDTLKIVDKELKRLKGITIK